jgi:hypothetical protein
MGQVESASECSCELVLRTRKRRLGWRQFACERCSKSRWKASLRQLTLTPHKKLFICHKYQSLVLDLKAVAPSNSKQAHLGRGARNETGSRNMCTVRWFVVLLVKCRCVKDSFTVLISSSSSQSLARAARYRQRC